MSDAIKIILKYVQYFISLFTIGVVLCYNMLSLLKICDDEFLTKIIPCIMSFITANFICSHIIKEE